MGMFDWYEPVPELSCPVCKRPLKEWQGKDGPNALFLWRQGHAGPVDQLIDDPEMKLDAQDIAKTRLPTTFLIYSYDCGCPYPVEAFCKLQGEVWVTAEVVDETNATQRREETKAQWKARQEWLRGKPKK